MVQPYLFTGRFTDAMSDLTHMDARWYSAQSMRFLSPDYYNLQQLALPRQAQHRLLPYLGKNSLDLLRDPAQQMRYGYVAGNMVSWVDWYGLAEFCQSVSWHCSIADGPGGTTYIVPIATYDTAKGDKALVASVVEFNKRLDEAVRNEDVAAFNELVHNGDISPSLNFKWAGDAAKIGFHTQVAGPVTGTANLNTFDSLIVEGAKYGTGVTKAGWMQGSAEYVRDKVVDAIKDSAVTPQDKVSILHGSEYMSDAYLNWTSGNNNQKVTCRVVFND